MSLSLEKQTTTPDAKRMLFLNFSHYIFLFFISLAQSSLKTRLHHIHIFAHLFDNFLTKKNCISDSASAKLKKIPEECKTMTFFYEDHTKETTEAFLINRFATL